MNIEFNGKHISIESEMTVGELLDRLDLKADDYIVVRDGRISRLTELLDEDSSVIILRAIVGG